MEYKLDDPKGLGISSDGLDGLRERANRAIGDGPLPSLQVALAREGKLVLFETFGSESNSSRYNIYSCTKPLVASAVWRLMGEGLIELALPAAHYFPEFAANGKSGITVEQLLCHTSGFPEASLGPQHWSSREKRIERMAGWELEWEPGSRMVYHSLSAHWVLAELIERVTACDYRDYIRREILLPLGLTRFQLGVPEAEQGDIATLSSVGSPPTSEEIKALFGAEITWPDTTDDSMLVFNEPGARAVGVPGGGAVASAADVALFYQALLHNGEALWNEQILADALGKVWVNHVDPITRVPANRGLGVVIAGDDKHKAYRGMGRTVSSQAFGHQGVGNQVSWADPETGLSFCMLTNGLDANPLRSARLASAMSNRAGACAV